MTSAPSNTQELVDDMEHQRAHEQMLMRLLECATAERRQLRAEIDSLKRQQTTDRDAIIALRSDPNEGRFLYIPETDTIILPREEEAQP